jgi:Domain of unknown function (DUF4911)
MEADSGKEDLISPKPIELDSDTVILYLKVAGSQVVKFQAFFETYEGIGTVRTIDIRSSLISILTPKDQVADCQRLLSSIKKEIPWECAAEKFVTNDLNNRN